MISQKTNIKNPSNKHQASAPLNQKIIIPDIKSIKDITIQLDFSQMSYVPEKTLNRPNIMLNEPEYGGVVAPH